ncbi:hypothetical protein D5S19_21495 [Amycolatopsis panacis]|uniref:Uncharacterized protein n=2 Tax=Amycolatopsis panacis TaxID=2340917 RepID=A0A419HZS8_9PSEU|nr:hypothetical protein D5S19_21495 [Amycolatopsis panacis]
MSGNSEQDKLAAAKERMAETGASIAETAAKLRAAIDAGTVPPKATTQFAAMLEEIAAQMRPESPDNTD